MLKLLWLFALVPGSALSGTCGGALVQICPDAAGPVGAVADPEIEPAIPFGRKVLRVAARPPAFGVGDIFPVADHSLLMDPARYGLPPVSDGWHYYAVDGFVYRVETATAKVIAANRSSDARLR